MPTPSAASASSSSSSSSAPRHRHRSARPSRDQLKRHLELLGSLSAPFPPELPSPPPSRSSSPATGSKRKLDSQPPAESSKRPRIADLPEKPRRNVISSNHSLRSEPEEGELRDEPSSPPPAPPASRQGPKQHQPQPLPISSSSSARSLPIPRPRKKLHRGDPSFDDIKARYHKYGRMLKYSGDARYWSSYPSTHKGFKPLPHPPPPNSPYHQQSALMSRLELIDALVCFTYSLWLTDWTKDSCIPSSWATIEGFLGWTKKKWQNDNASEREKAFLGLIWMIEAFIHSRRVAYMNRIQVEGEIKSHLDKARALVEAATPNPSAGVTPAGSQHTPPMLPSPESIAPTHSANSTPTGRPTGTPNPNAPPPPSSQPTPPSQSRPPSRPFAHSTLHPLASTITVPITASFTHTLNTLSHALSCASYAMKMAQTHLTLRTLAAHFPVTFTRVVHSTMRQEDECEPDIEDEDGELFWPGAPATGEGLGWVCLMGKAMIKEYGKEVGYLGYDGVVPKPEASAGSLRPDRR